MMPKYSIIIPHKLAESNNMSLGMNLQMLLENSVYPFELIIETSAPRDPYMIWNEAAKQARADILVFTNSDVLMAPGWDRFMVDFCEPNAIMTGYLVEPGNIGVAEENIHNSFGMHPSTFNRQQFEQWVAAQNTPECVEQRGWYMPCAVDRKWFIDTGGFDTAIPFPHPNDIIFWDRCIREYGTRLLRVRSYAYHFQCLSGRV